MRAIKHRAGEASGAAMSPKAAGVGCQQNFHARGSSPKGKPREPEWGKPICHMLLPTAIHDRRSENALCRVALPYPRHIHRHQQIEIIGMVFRNIEKVAVSIFSIWREY